MRQANWEYHYQRGLGSKTRNCSLRGAVTEKLDGKISINIHHFKHHSSAIRYQAKQAVMQAVKEGFKNTERVVFTFIDFTGAYGSDAAQQELINILLGKTLDLHDAYIQYTKQWAVKAFVHIRKQMQKTLEEWYKAYGVEFIYREYKSWKGIEKHIEPVKYDRDYYNMKAKREEWGMILKDGLEKFKTKEILAAERHFSESIEKLAYRLIKKGVETKDMKIVTARVGVNIEIKIDCKGVITKAWTIVASGPVQRPHYRYLIK